MHTTVCNLILTSINQVLLCKVVEAYYAFIAVYIIMYTLSVLIIFFPYCSCILTFLHSLYYMYLI